MYAANLLDTELRRVDLLRADPREAEMGFTYLTGTKVTAQQSGQAASLKGATLPDGTTLTSEAEPEPAPAETTAEDAERKTDQPGDLDAGEGVDDSTSAQVRMLLEES